MDSLREQGRRVFDQQFGCIETLVRRVARRRRLGYEEEQELYSRVMLHVVEDDYAVLRSFQGRSSWKTYLMVMIQRVLLDWRVQEWGRYRPSAKVRRLGSTAVLLDERINRDGFSPAEAVGDVLGRGVAEHAAEVEALADAIPRRCRRRLVEGEETLALLAGGERADSRVEDAWREQAHAKVRGGLAMALARLTDEERGLLRLRFVLGMTVQAIGRKTDAEARLLYRRYATIIRRLRRDLVAMGLTWREVRSMVAGAEWGLAAELCAGRRGSTRKKVKVAWLEPAAWATAAGRREGAGRVGSERARYLPQATERGPTRRRAESRDETAGESRGSVRRCASHSRRCRHGR